MELRGGGWRYRSSVSKAARWCCVSICFLLVGALILDDYSWSANLDMTSSRSDSFTQGRRRGLGEGPGSYPPRCAAKCGECTPCRPVHVPVPPGTPVITEYYPEAWRCKCGDKLYMP